MGRLLAVVKHYIAKKRYLVRELAGTLLRHHNVGMPKRSSKKPVEASEPLPPATESAPGVGAAPQPEVQKNPAAVALGRLGGLKGGKARAKKLTAKQRSEIAKKAAQARWKKK